MRRLLRFLLSAALMTTGVVTLAPQAVALPQRFQKQTVLSGLVSPTNVEFSPDGRVFVAEKGGYLKVFDSLTDTTPTVYATAIPLNTWTHLAATYDGTTLRLYLNGTQTSQRTAGGPIRTDTSPLRIGGNSIWGEYFSGLIDEVRIYNRALSPTEIQADMNTPVT